MDSPARRGKHRLAVPLKHVPDVIVGAVEALGVYAVQLAHASGKVGIRCFDQQVVVIGH